MPRLSRSARSLFLPALAILLVAGACPQDNEDLPRGRPAPAGMLRLGYPEEPRSLNPILARSPAARDILRAVLPSFHLVTPELRYRPYLLASEPTIETVGRRLLVRFRLRDEARWSDGRPVTVDDVAFTWRAMTDPNLPVAVRDGFEYVVDVVRESDSVGTLVLSHQFAGWRDLFSAGRFVLPKPATGGPQAVTKWGRGPPVAGGPFRIGQRVRGRSILLEHNPRFFGPRPLLEAIRVEFVPDASTALQLLQAGKLDAVAPTAGISWGRRLARTPSVDTSSTFGPQLVHLLVNTPSARDVQERRRIARAIDRERFIDVVIREEGRRAESVLAPEQQGDVPAWSRYARATAPEQLRSTTELTLAYTEGELYDVLARYIQAELDRAGGDVELVPLDAEVFQHEWLPELRFDLALWESRSGPEPWLTRWFSVRGGERVSGVVTRELDAALSEGERGGPERLAAVAEAQQHLADLIPVVPLFQPKVTMGWRAGIRGIVANATVDGPLWNAWNWSKAEV